MSKFRAILFLFLCFGCTSLSTAQQQSKLASTFNDTKLYHEERKELQFERAKTYRDSSGRLIAFELKVVQYDNRYIEFERQGNPYAGFAAILFKPGDLEPEEYAYIVNLLTLWESEKKLKGKK